MMSSVMYGLRTVAYRHHVCTSHCPSLRSVLIVKLHFPNSRLFSAPRDLRRFGYKTSKNRDVVMYSTAAVLVALAASYAAVPLYRIYCQSTGKGGKAIADSDSAQKVANMKLVKDRKITVRFEADTSSRIAWDFKPTVSQVVVSPGETALAFYTATNPTTRPVTGISTYSVMPYEAGLYLNKIQCFCFEEQRLNPKEEVDMPVFFYIDPQFAEDPRLENVDDIILSYVFFESKDDSNLPALLNPEYPKPAHLKQ